jgi:replicative DNA helicase
MADISLEKMLPNNLEAERSILGAILLEEKAINVALGTIEATDFYLDSHRRIFAKMVEVIDSGSGLDLITLKNALQSSNELEATGGAAYLVSLTDGLPRAMNIEHYASIVREKAALRIGVQAGNELMTRCYDEQPFKDVIDDAFIRLDGELSKMQRKEGPREISDLVSEAFRTIENIANHKTSGGFKLGFSELDRMIPTGVHRKNLVIIAGRPGHGKTSMLLGIAIQMAKIGTPIIIFSLEMAEMELIMRMLSAMSRVDLTRMNTGFMNKEDWNRLSRAAGDLSALPIWIDDSSALTVSDMRSRTRRIPTEIPVILIDYLQLVSPPKHLQRANDVEKIGAVSVALKNMAKSTNASVIAAAQLSRSTEKRRDQTPKLSDLRQSGQIEQDADVVILLHRPELARETEENAGLADVIIGKQRNGMTGSFSMAFERHYSTFSNLYQEQE